MARRAPAALSVPFHTHGPAPRRFGMFTFGLQWYQLGLVVGLLSPSFLAADQRRTTEDPLLPTIRFEGLRPGDPAGRNGLRNPERGLRIETLIAAPGGAAVWGPAFHLKGEVSEGYSDQWWILDAKRYEPDGLTLAQTYCYLDTIGICCFWPF